MQIIGGKHRFQKLYVPKSKHVRPTSGYLRESLFNICQTLIEDSIFLDLFSGCGAMGLEALSRGASKAIFVDKHPLSIKSIKQNVQKLNEEQKSLIIFSDVFDAIRKLSAQGMQFDIVYADPPYHQESGSLSLSDKLLQQFDQNPTLLKQQGYLFLEDSKNSIKENLSLQHLVLKSIRTMGVSVLRQYILKN